MRRFDRYAVAPLEHGLQRGGVAAPQHRHQRLLPRHERTDRAFGDRFPAFAPVGRRVPGRTVRTLFSSITPRSAHGVRSPVAGGG